jgi:hypothetical protein
MDEVRPRLISHWCALPSALWDCGLLGRVNVRLGWPASISSQMPKCALASCDDLDDRTGPCCHPQVQQIAGQGGGEVAPDSGLVALLVTDRLLPSSPLMLPTFHSRPPRLPRGSSSGANFSALAAYPTTCASFHPGGNRVRERAPGAYLGPS